MADEPVGPPGDDVADLLPAYALGALDEADELVVERALDREPRYREMLQEHLESVAVLAGSHALAVPSAEVRQRIMTRVLPMAAPEPVVRPAPRVPFALLGVAAALAVAVVGLGAFSTVQQQRVVQLQDEVDVVTAEAEGARSNLVGLSDMVADSVAMTALTPAQRIEQSGAPEEGADDAGGVSKWSEREDAWFHGRKARGILITRPDGESMLLVRGLPALEPGLTYRAWWWDDAHETKSAGVFTVGDGGYAWVRLVGDVNAMRRLGVSVESEMGALEPGPDLVLHAHVHVIGKGDAAQ